MMFPIVGGFLASISRREETLVPQLDGWKHWLCPKSSEEISDIPLEAVLESVPSLWLVKMQKAAWEMPKPDETYKFLTSVMSSLVDLILTVDREYSG
jgi:hypothetical protein